MPVLGNGPPPVQPADDAGEQTHAAVLDIRFEAQIPIVETTIHILHLQHERQTDGDEWKVPEARLVDIKASDVGEQLVISPIFKTYRTGGQWRERWISVREQGVHQGDSFIDRLVLLFQIALQRFLPSQPDIAVGGIAGNAEIEVVGAGRVDPCLDVISRVFNGLLVGVRLAIGEQLSSQRGPAVAGQPPRIGCQCPGG